MTGHKSTSPKQCIQRLQHLRLSGEPTARLCCLATTSVAWTGPIPVTCLSSVPLTPSSGCSSLPLGFVWPAAA